MVAKHPPMPLVQVRKESVGGKGDCQCEAGRKCGRKVGHHKGSRAISPLALAIH